MWSCLMTTISVILVTGGDGGAVHGGRSAELLHTNGSHLCSLPDLPFRREMHSQTGLTLCGGIYTRTSCYTLTSSGSWEQTHSLSRERWHHSAWASPQGVMLLGGWDRSAWTTDHFNRSFETGLDWKMKEGTLYGLF